MTCCSEQRLTWGMFEQVYNGTFVEGTGNGDVPYPEFFGRDTSCPKCLAAKRKAAAAVGLSVRCSLFHWNGRSRPLVVAGSAFDLANLGKVVVQGSKSYSQNGSEGKERELFGGLLQEFHKCLEYCYRFRKVMTESPVRKHKSYSLDKLVEKLISTGESLWTEIEDIMWSVSRYIMPTPGSKWQRHEIFRNFFYATFDQSQQGLRTRKFMRDVRKWNSDCVAKQWDMTKCIRKVEGEK